MRKTSFSAIPVRHATVGLFYNEELFAERGVAGPPKTLEEEIAELRNSEKVEAELAALKARLSGGSSQEG